MKANMPATKFQKIIFGLMMAAAMVVGMETYNLLLKAGGWESGMLRTLFGELIPMTLIVMTLQALVAARIVRALLARHLAAASGPITPGRLRLEMQLCTVAVMCPLMSLVAVLIFKRPAVSIYLDTLIRNLPMALCWQLLVAGPLVRFLFGRLFVEKS